MNALKRYFGIILIVLAPFIIYQLIVGAVQHINAKGTKDINNPVIWIIIIGIFIPIAVGLVIFGWYAFKGAYDELPEKSNNLE